ncbi:MAG: hypothetical protein ACI4PM_05180 [Butyricicoccus sp.]
MLTKLIAQEFRATRRVYLPAFLAIAVLSVLNAILFATVWNSETFSVPAGLIFTLYIFALFAVWVLALVYTIQRFSKNLLSDEGYLMFTLPVKPSQLIWSKAITSLVWIVLTAILCCLSLFLIFTPAMAASSDGSVGFLRLFQVLGYMLSEMWKQFGVHVILVAVETLIACIVTILAFCMKIYACLSTGNLFNRHRTAWAFGAYVLFSIIVQAVMMIATSINSSYSIISLPDLPLTSCVELSLISMIVLQIVLGAIYYVITNVILSRHLNLQ